MVFVRTIKGKKYYYATKRIDGKVKQIFLGTVEPKIVIPSWWVSERKIEKWKEINKLREMFGLPPLKVFKEYYSGWDKKTFDWKKVRKRVL